MATKILFPRFEYEATHERNYADRTIVQRAPLLRWLNVKQVKQITELQSVQETAKTRDKKGWWGEWHHQESATSIPRVKASPRTDTIELFSSTVIKHTYEWDCQAAEGHKIEVVLHRLDLDYYSPTVGATIEEYAMLIAHPYGNKGERAVVRGRDGEWESADMPENQEYAKFCLRTLGELAANSDPYARGSMHRVLMSSVGSR